MVCGKNLTSLSTCINVSFIELFLLFLIIYKTISIIPLVCIYVCFYLTSLILPLFFSMFFRSLYLFLHHYSAVLIEIALWQDLISGTANSPSLLFILSNVLAIHKPLVFHINIKISLVCSGLATINLGVNFLFNYSIGINFVSCICRFVFLIRSLKKSYSLSLEI